MKKTGVFNLALRKDSNLVSPSKPIDEKLATIVQQPQAGTSQSINAQNATGNIFEECISYGMRELPKNLQSYDVLCAKEVKAYKDRMRKIKNTGGAFRIKLSDSILSGSKHTFLELSQQNNNTNCITSKELDEFYSTIVKTQGTQRQGLGQAQVKFRTQREHNIKVSQLTKKFDKLKDTWDMLDQVSQGRSLYSSVSKLGKSYLKSVPSVAMSAKNLHNHRKKLQQLEKNTLKLQKQNILPVYWPQNLRNPQSLDHYLDQKYIQQIEREGLKLRGTKKLDKEYAWIKQKKVELFEPIEEKSRFAIRRQNGGNQDSRQDTSTVDGQTLAGSRLTSNFFNFSSP